METVFENRFYGKYKMIAEFARKYSIGPRPFVVGIVAAVYAYLVFRSWWHGILLEMVPTLLWVGMIFTALYFLPNYYAWATLRNTKKQNDGVLPETVITFGDTIEIHEGMVHLTIEYRKIERVVRLKNSYVLMNGKRTGIILDPNGFTKGNFSEFKQFLRTKRPDLKIPE